MILNDLYLNNRRCLQVKTLFHFTTLLFFPIVKVCSDQKKPNGQFELPADAETIQNFVRSLPIRKVNGIGNVTEQLLKRVLGIETCDDLFNKRGYLAILFSEITFG